MGEDCYEGEKCIQYTYGHICSHGRIKSSEAPGHNVGNSSSLMNNYTRTNK